MDGRKGNAKERGKLREEERMAVQREKERERELADAVKIGEEISNSNKIHAEKTHQLKKCPTRKPSDKPASIEAAQNQRL